MKGKKVLNKKNIYIPEPMRKGLPGASHARAPLGMGTPGDGHRALAALRELLPRTVQSPRTGGTKGVAQGRGRARAKV